MKQLALELTPAPEPTFDNFVTGRNAEALAHVRAALAGTAERFVYLWGEPGCGRTHLLKASARAGGEYVACADHACFTTASVLAVDDVAQLNAGAQIALFNRYNELREQGGALIASGNVPPAQLDLRADLVTRLGWGLVLQLHALSDSEKSQALAQRAQARGFTLPDEVNRWLLTHAPRDIGALFDALDELDRLSMETHRAITVALAREWLKASGWIKIQ